MSSGPKCTSGSEHQAFVAAKGLKAYEQKVDHLCKGQRDHDEEDA